jgi:predicted nucleic acid-binding protein
MRKTKEVRPVVYWDSCMYIHWLTGNQPEGLDDNAGLKEQIRRFKAGEVVLCASVVTSVEVLACTLPEDRVREFLRLREMRDDFSHVAVDPVVADRAHEIRDYYQSLKDHHSGKTLSTPDAIHLATATLHEVDALYTFDKKRRRFLGLIPLSGNVAGKYDLRIEKPPVPIPVATPEEPSSPATLFPDDENAEAQ